jgi:hypothetical protein
MTSRADVRTALDFFVGHGWTAEQSAGIVANLVAESNLNPEAVGDGGQAYGIAQWHGDRQAHFAALIGKDIHGSSLDDQLAFVHGELVGTEKAAGDALRACTTAGEAGACVSSKYERPADQAGEASRRATLAESIFAEYGGTVSSGEPVAEKPTPTAAPTPQGAPVPFLALLPLIAQFIPQIMTLIKPGSASTAKDAAVAGTILNTVVQAAGILNPDGTPAPVNAATVGAAADKMTADPALAKSVQQAVVTHPDIMPLLEVGGGVAAARAADVQQQQSTVPFWKGSAVFWISVILLPMIYWYVGASIIGGIEIPADWPWYAQLPLKFFGLAWDAGAKVGLANLVVGLVLGGIVGVYFGVSVTQQKQQAESASTGKQA